MSDLLGQAISEWNRLVRRVEESAEIGWTGLRGLTWDAFMKSKTPAQTLSDIRAMADDFERKEAEYRRSQRA
jgi:hypothetical protein